MHLFVHPCINRINLSCSLHVSNGDVSLCLLIEAQLRDKSEKEELYRLRQALNSTCSTCKRCTVRHCLRPKLKGRRASTLCSVSVTIWTLFHKPLFVTKDLGQRSGQTTCSSRSTSIVLLGSQPQPSLADAQMQKIDLTCATICRCHDSGSYVTSLDERFASVGIDSIDNVLQLL